ncbi:MAG TPA: DUF4870 domain-containing protein [Luteibacter sp.]|jgi:hypothetical protein|uniref:DUF4870 domain-containing protein n=1 Tax=Luteibacter sp. TaxID=1886636 RepID=UPI002F416F5D
MSTPSDQVPPPPSPPPYDPVPPPSAGPAADDKNIAMLTHLSGLIFSVLVPLIVWLVYKDRADKQYLVREAKEALNFQITIVLAYFIGGILTVILIGGLIVFLAWLANLIFCIVAALKVSSDGTYRYPYTLRLIN